MTIPPIVTFVIAEKIHSEFIFVCVIDINVSFSSSLAICGRTHGPPRLQGNVWVLDQGKLGTHL